MSTAIRTVFRDHDPLVQAIGLHYHLAAMHPFLDGNGRTARALEALMLQRTGLRDTRFIAMSNYYYEEKSGYLTALADTRAADHDLTPFLKFALKGIEIQCRRLLGEIREQVARALFRNTVTDLFGRLKSPRKRVISARHVQLLNLLLEEEEMTLGEIQHRTAHLYSLKNPHKALARDLNYLIALRTLSVTRLDPATTSVTINLQWPTQITEAEFFRLVKALPKPESAAAARHVGPRARRSQHPSS